MDRETTIGHLRSFVHDGSEQSFRQLVTAHQALVRAAALSHLGECRYLADDVTQEVFATLARKAHLLKEDTHLAAWLHRVACRTASNQFAWSAAADGVSPMPLSSRRFRIPPFRPLTSHTK